MNPAFPTPFQFRGRENDGVARLYYYRARYYHPGLARFVSEDPIGLASGDTNLYAYVRNGPTRYFDPSGLQQIERVDPFSGPSDARECMPRCTTVGDVINREFAKARERYEPVLKHVGEKVLEGLLEFMCHRYRVECPTGPFPPNPSPSPDVQLPGFLESGIVSIPQSFPIHGRKDSRNGAF